MMQAEYQHTIQSRSRPSSDSHRSGDAERPTAQSSKGQKLNQVVQNFYSKAAQVIVQARQPVTPLYARGSTTKRLNKWFNLETTDTDAFREELNPWKTVDVSHSSFSPTRPLKIEVVLSFRDLTPDQRLTLLSADGHRSDVMSPDPRKHFASGEIVLESWSVDWIEPTAHEPPELAASYKKAIAIFRSLYTLARLLPTWKLRKRLSKSKLSSASLKVSCRIETPTEYSLHEPSIGLDRPAAASSENKIGSHLFHAVETPAGKLRIALRYRQECDFRVDDSEALLSSHFASSERYQDRTQTSLPSSARATARIASLTYRDSNNSLPNFALADSRIGGHSSFTRADRRPSAIHPFKSPSLSGSPANEGTQSFRAVSRTSSATSVERSSQRLATYPQSHRIPGTVEPVSHSTSSSPRQATVPPLVKRYSSSFGQRTSSFSGRRRPSQASESAIHMRSNSTSEASSRSGSISQQTTTEEAEGLDAFVRMLDSRKPLKGSQFTETSIRPSAQVSAGDNKIRSELDKFQRLRESHAILSDSLVQSTILRAHPSVPIRRLSHNSISLTSGGSSPGKPISPHMPAIPSRLSETSIMPRPSSKGRENPMEAKGSQPDGKSPGPMRIPMPKSSPGSDDRQQAQTECHSASSSKPLTYCVDLDATGTARDALVRSPAFRERDSSQIPSDDRDGAQDRYTGRRELATGNWRQTVETSGTACREHEAQPSASDSGSGMTLANKAPGIESAAGLPDDDDLFFAMSDIHLSRV